MEENQEINGLQAGKEQLQQDPSLMAEFNGDGERKFKMLPKSISEMFIPLIQSEIERQLQEFEEK